MFQLKLITIVGPTASGKSEVALELAKKLGNAVIIGCDSRQVYQGCDLGTGKVKGNWVSTNQYFKEFAEVFEKVYNYEHVPHFLIDYVPVESVYSVERFVSDFNDIVSRLLLVKTVQYIILVGGTGYYAQAVLEGWQFTQCSQIGYSSLSETEPPADWQQRALYYKSVLTHNTRMLNHSDLYNPRRLVSYLNPPIQKNGLRTILQNLGVFALIPSKESLKNSVYSRLQERLEQGMFEEYYELLVQYGKVVSHRAIEYQCLEYFLLGQVNLGTCKEMILSKTMHYIKRQLTWLSKFPQMIPIETVQNILSVMMITPSEMSEGLNTTIHNNVTDIT